MAVAVVPVRVKNRLNFRAPKVSVTDCWGRLRQNLQNRRKCFRPLWLRTADVAVLPAVLRIDLPGMRCCWNCARAAVGSCGVGAPAFAWPSGMSNFWPRMEGKSVRRVDDGVWTVDWICVFRILIPRVPCRRGRMDVQ